ncbi:hypothetical protein HYT05_03805 [Candidatus Kaiserbacteria bacterium]|nr:hypothetical protein [Candidatus Kaiserbacteria bacterium]
MRLLSFVTTLLAAAFLALPAFAHDVACVPVDLTPLQRAAGFVTLTNVGMTVGVLLTIGCFLFLFGRWILMLLAAFLFIPVEFYEVLGYVAAALLIVSGKLIAPSLETWTSFAGCLLLGGMIMLTGHLHKMKSNYVRFFLTLFVIWAPIAAIYGNPWVGFISVMALMGSVGFAGEVIPGFGYVLGFRGKDELARATTTGFMVLTLFVITRIFAGDNPHVQVFEQGALWCGAFVGYLGLLIASSRWYTDRVNYFIMQLITIAAGVTAVAVGSIFGIAPLLGIAGTFFGLYCIEKPFEIPDVSAMGYAMIGLIVGIGVYLVSWWGQYHMDLIRPFLLF